MLKGIGTIWMILLATCAIARAQSPTPVQCPELLKRHGLLSRAQFQCGFEGYSEQMLESARTCSSKLSEKELQDILMEGMKGFDARERQRGRKRACSDILREFPTVVSAKDEGVTLVTITGKCAKFSIGTISLECNKIAYIQTAKTGRVSFNIPTDTGLIGLSGRSDLQPNLENYILVIDSVLNGKERTAAQGRCEASTSSDAKAFRTLKCTVSSKFGDIAIDFAGDATEVQIKRF